MPSVIAPPPVTADAIAGLRALAALIPVLTTKGLADTLAELDAKAEALTERERQVAADLAALASRKAAAEEAETKAVSVIEEASAADRQLHADRAALKASQTALAGERAALAAEASRSEQALADQSQALNGRAVSLDAREARLVKREAEVTERETVVAGKEQRLKAALAG